MAVFFFINISLRDDLVLFANIALFFPPQKARTVHIRYGSVLGWLR